MKTWRRNQILLQVVRGPGGELATTFMVVLVARSSLTLCDCTVARQAPLSLGFSRQNYWSGLPFPSPGDLTNPGAEPRSPALQADCLLSELQGNHT